MPQNRKVTLELPLFVMLPRKTIADRKWILNLNNYRNAHPLMLNDAKVQYKEVVQEATNYSEWDGEEFEKAHLHFILYPGSNRRVDKSNPLCIIEKFACDALTDIGFWRDDDSTHLPVSTYEFAEVDKKDPRCVLIIEEKT